MGTTDRNRARIGQLAIAAVVLAFVAHRVAVILSAGDFLFPIEPWEAKNTQIAWDLHSGRFGQPGFDLRAYIANSGSAHHAAYSTTALVYLLLSKVFGLGLMGVRLEPLLFWTGALAVWMECLRRLAGNTTALLAGVGLALVPANVIGWQLTFFGCHAESVLPLALAVGSWLLWLERGGRGVSASALTGLCFGYAAAFSYLLWPLLALLPVLLVLPPRPRPGGQALAALGAGALLGFWPIWLVLALNPSSLFAFSVTEDASTRLADLAVGRELSGPLFLETLRTGLRGFPDDYWVATAQAGALWGGERFEGWAWKLCVLGPLALAPAAWRFRGQGLGRLALVVALGPVAGLLFVAFGSPFKPEIPLRYLLGLAFLGWSAPGLAVGLGIAMVRQARSYWLWRVGGWALIVVGAVTLLWVSFPRIIEASSLVRTGRSAPLRDHRYVAYYNLGIGTIWAEQVAEVNDLIDVRSAQGNPDAFAGFQGGLLHDLQPTGLGRATWHPLPYQDDSLRVGLAEWRERRNHTAAGKAEPAGMAAENIGWGAGIRSRWDVPAATSALAAVDGEGLWPEDLPKARFWMGYGMGWGRAHPAPEQPAETELRSLDDEQREALLAGIEAGRALAAVPAEAAPAFRSIRGPAT